MRNFWLMATHEYRKMVRKRSFLAGTLGIPLLILVIMGLGIYVSVRGEDRRPVGYVDQAGILVPGAQPAATDADALEMRPYASLDEARQALAAGDIQAVYVLPADYLAHREVSLYYWQDDPGDEPRQSFRNFIRASLASALPPTVQEVLVEGTDLTVRSLEGNREISSNNPVTFILPFAASFLFIFVVMGSAGYLLQVVTDEKENRTVEIMVTSVTPTQLIGGKALGLMAVSLTQMILWLGVAVVALFIGANYIPLLQGVTMPWSFLGIILLYFLPAYALIAGLMTAIGGVVTELRQGQQIAGMLNLLFVAPFFFVALIFARPDSPILVVLTLFPTTSFVTVSMRWTLSVVPLWQLVSGWLLLVGTAAFSVWAAARIFRAGMLRYGQSLSLRGALAALRQS